MQRTYLAPQGPGSLLGAALVAAVLAGGPLMFGPMPAAWAGVLFESRGVEASRFAILAKPVARSDWSLLVLEQVQSAPACWQQRPDGLIDAALTRFDFSGICSRYIDSNGYSLRVANTDLANRYRLKLRQVGRDVQLLGSAPDASRDLLIGRGTVPARDRDGFVALRLEPEWQLRRRVYGGQTLSHLYFASDRSLAQLGGAPPERVALSTPSQGRSDTVEPTSRRPGVSQGSGAGPTTLKVIPFRP